MSESSPRAPERSRDTLWLLSGLVLLAFSGLAVGAVYLSGVGGGSADAGALSAPDFTLAGLDGQQYRLSDFSGRVVLVEFWATWCSPCRLQAEILARLHDEVFTDRMQFLAVSLGEPEEIVRGFVERDPFPYPVLLDPEEKLGYALEVYALPTVMIVNGEGLITFLRPGISDGETLRRALAEASS